jgi:hypothetical protein
MPHEHGTVFYVHGANISPAALSARVALLQEGLTAHGLEDVRLVAPPWRQNSGMVLGPVEITLPFAGARATFAPDLAANLEARLAALNPFTVGVQGLIWRAFTNYFDDRRPELMRLIGNQLLGDSLAYQVYRDRILDYVGSQLVEGLPQPIVAVGESLGGVILVELLSEHRAGLPPAAGLVAVGNQAPILYALGALVSLPYEGEVAPFGPWWNVYDPRDFLSFLAAPIFRRYETRIEDVRVESGRPFPEAHGAYWEVEETWDVIPEAFGRT